jgi:hypothetical protein
MVTSCGGFEFTWRRFGGGEDEMAREKEKGLRWWGDGEHERERERERDIKGVFFLQFCDGREVLQPIVFINQQTLHVEHLCNGVNVAEENNVALQK